MSTFTNPLLPHGADPYAVLHDGAYYFLATEGDRLSLWRTPDLTELKTAEYKTVWTPPPGTDHSHNLWAPELHFLDGAWYLYYAADDGQSDHHKMFVLENTSPDPFAGEFTLKARLKTDPEDHWAIDGTVFEQNGALYMAWSGWERPVADGVETACLFLARMSDPWTIASDRVVISRPEYDWERRWENPADWNNGPGRTVYVNEGPALLRRGGRLFLAYSASGCWTPHYCLGLLTADADSDLLDPASWRKSPTPVFAQSPENGVYGPGHNSFVPSPDGTEDWLLYHANDRPEHGCGGHRTPRLQRVTWREDGTPDFGVPSPISQEIEKPSGSGG